MTIINVLTLDGALASSTNDSATAGRLGEFISATVLTASAVSLTTDTPANVTSISLTAGDWDVRGTVATKPSAGTTGTYVTGAINTTSATLPTIPGAGAYAQLNVAIPGTAVQVIAVGVTRISISSTTTVFLVAQAGFAISTNAVYGFLGARRVR